MRTGRSRQARSPSSSWTTTPPRCSPKAKPRRRKLSRRTAKGCQSIADDDQPVGAGLAAPGLARTAEHLAHVRALLVAREGLVFFGRRVETLDRVGEPVGRPDPVLVVDIDRIGPGLALRHRVMRPGLLVRIVAADAAAVPEARPQHALGIRPDAARAHALARRLDDGDLAGIAVDVPDVVAGKRGVPDLVCGRDRDAVGAAPGRAPGLDLADLRVEAAVYAGLAGEPDHARLVHDGRVEIGVGELLRQREELHLMGLEVDARDRVVAAFGEPGGAVRPDDDAVRCGARPEREFVELSS